MFAAVSVVLGAMVVPVVMVDLAVVADGAGLLEPQDLQATTQLAGPGARMEPSAKEACSQATGVSMQEAEARVWVALSLSMVAAN